MEKAQKGRIVEYQHFDLIKVKINNNEGLDLVYYNKLYPNQTEEPKSKNVHHPDLKTAMDKLRLYYATRIGLLEGWDLARDQLKDNPTGLAEAIKGHENIIKRITMKSLTFSGEGETLGVSLSAYFKFPKKGGTGIPSGKFNLSKGEHADDLLAICEEIKKEVCAYRFQKKFSQQEIKQSGEPSGPMFDETEDDDKK